MAGQDPRVTRAARGSPCCSDGDRRRRSDGRPGRSIGIGDGDAAGIDYSTDHASATGSPCCSDGLSADFIGYSSGFYCLLRGAPLVSSQCEEKEEMIVEVHNQINI